MIRTFTIILSILLIILGIMGFFPDFKTGGNLFGLFATNLELNVFHLVTGILGLLCGLSSSLNSKVYVIVVGILYGLLAILGLAHSDGLLLSMFANNIANNWLHGGVSVLSLYFGLTFKN